MKTHLSFSGSLQPDDAKAVMDILRSAIRRRPKESGFFVLSRDFYEGEFINTYCDSSECSYCGSPVSQKGAENAPNTDS